MHLNTFNITNINMNTPGLDSMGSDLDKTTNFDMPIDLTINDFPLKYKALYSTYLMCFFSFCINGPTFILVTFSSSYPI